MRYRRARTPGATYFFTIVTYQRQKLFHRPELVEYLREAFRTVQTNHPFTIDAIVVLPDHLHCIWTLPPEDANFSTRWRLIKTNFSRTCPQQYKRDPNQSRQRKQEQAIWQRRFWEHQIRDQQDLNQHIDYIHYNPVHHRLVHRVRYWPYSSFHRYVQRGDYDIDWGVEASISFESNIGYE
ncbi:MAG: REP-associated tyrosine transposase [Limnoraphis robusta]|jgi:putative transposase